MNREELERARPYLQGYIAQALRGGASIEAAVAEAVASWQHREASEAAAREAVDRLLTGGQP